MRTSCYGPPALLILLGLGQIACNPKAPASETVGAARVDTTVSRDDTTAAPRSDTMIPRVDTSAGRPDTSAATPPITPPATPGDTSSSGAAQPSNQQAAGPAGQPKVSRLEYEGWRQYSVHCARCHGQDVLPNPVAANLLISLGPGGSVDTEQKFADIVTAGRPARGMPAFKGVLTPDQIRAIYAYVQGRAAKRIPPGRPESPTG